MRIATRTRVGLFFAGAGIIGYALGPVVWIATLSIKGGDDINNQKFLPTHVSWDNYTTVFHTALFTSALRNSIGIASIATATSAISSCDRTGPILTGRGMAYSFRNQTVVAEIADRVAVMT